MRILRWLCALGLHTRQVTFRLEAPAPTVTKITFEMIKAWLGPVVYVRGCLACGKELERQEDWRE